MYARRWAPPHAKPFWKRELSNDYRMLLSFMVHKGSPNCHWSEVGSASVSDIYSRVSVLAWNQEMFALMPMPPWQQEKARWCYIYIAFHIRLGEPPRIFGQQASSFCAIVTVVAVECLRRDSFENRWARITAPLP